MRFPPLKVNNRAIYLLLTAMLVGVRAFAQDYPRREMDPERLVDEIFPQQNLDINYQAQYENLLQQYSHPLDLNRATEEELRSLYILREDQVEELIKKRNEEGLLLSVYELQSISSFDLATIYKLMPFVYVRDLSTTLDRAFLNRLLDDNNNYLIVRSERTLESQEGYRATASKAIQYAGSPFEYYTRFRMSKPGDFSLGLTTEKDAGEAFEFKPSKHYYGMDFISFHAQVLHKGWVKNLVAGDFLSQFGQGLVLGGGFGMGKGSETITTLRRSNLGFIPYSSVNESNFFRGVASSLSLSEKLTLHSFVSAIRRDAVASADSTDEDYAFVSSFAMTGYHRTGSEIRSRKQIMETNYGAIVDYTSRSLQVGLLVHQTDFGLPITKNPTVYNQFTFRGSQNTNVSLYCNYTKDNFTFFSETAQTIDHGSATVAGVLGSVTRSLDISLLYRRYQKNFHSFYSNAIAENTLPQNESGYYSGWKYILSKKYSLYGYLDLFHFPWLRYRAYSPGDGSEWLARFNYQPTKTTSLYAQWRDEVKNRNLSPYNNLFKTGSGLKRIIWLNADYSATRTVSFKSRVQFTSYQLGGHTSRGFVILQDLNIDAGRFSFSSRYSLFHSDDYDSRQYVYERDVLLAFSFPAYFGTGIHTYLLTRVRLSRTCDMWIRWSHTRYTDRSVIGTEGETINGNTRNDVKLQLRKLF